MKMSHQFYLILALLFAGSAGMAAQTDDPFPDVPTHKYSMNMTITGYVRTNGASVTKDDNTIVAVYHNDEIRGKGILFDQSKYSDLMMLTVYGEKEGEALYFRVFTKGRIIEVDQGLTYTVNGRNGELADPYYIDLPELISTDFTPEGWATTCLPYKAGVPDGVDVWLVTGVENYQLVMQKADGRVLPANLPVLLQGEPSMHIEWPHRVTDADISPVGNILHGTLEATDVAANSVLTLGHALDTGIIGFWRYTETSVPAYRAYLTEAEAPADVKGYTIPVGSDDTAIRAVFSASKENVAQGWYDMGGRRTDAKKAGLYVRDGKKIIVK